jgi:hypothetical protein
MAFSSGVYLGSHSTVSQCAGGQGGERALAGVDRTIVLDQHDRLDGSPGLGAEETIELLKMSDEGDCPEIGGIGAEAI